LPSPPTPSRPSPSSKRRVPRPRTGGTGVSGRLDEQLCFALYAAGNAIVRAYTPLLKPVGLTYVGYLALLVLWEADGCTVGDVGRRLFLDSGTLTPVLRRLERIGYLTRERSPHDEREVRVRLTPAGRELESRLGDVRAQIACRAALAPADFRQLRAELHALRARFALSPAQ
jgi:DNA-binding MarR family transcriptional regulator